MKTNKLRLGLPSGSLENKTLEMFEKAWFKIKKADRSYFPTIDDTEIECVFFRSQEISKYIESWVIDAWLCWDDWILENGSNVLSMWELNYSKNSFAPIRLILACKKDYNITDLKYFEGKTICTEFVNITKKYFADKNINVNVEYSWWTTEAKIPDIWAWIVDITETWNSLKANNLEIIDTILESRVNFSYNNSIEPDSWKYSKIRDIYTLLNWVIECDKKSLIKINLNKQNLVEILRVLPSLKKPTITKLTDRNYLWIESVVTNSDIKYLIPKLKNLWALDIIKIPLDLVVL